MKTTIDIFASNSDNGLPAYENILVEPLGADLFRLVCSPGLADGLAAGDVIRVRSRDDFDVVSRGGNICVQIYCAQPHDVLKRTAERELLPLGAALDGEAEKVLVYTVPAEAGFPRLEKALGAMVRADPRAEWYYGNVYDPVDGVTPLNWWQT